MQDPLWPVVVGTLSGTLLGFVSAWVLEWFRWRRHRSERWDEIKRAALARLLLTAETLLWRGREARQLKADFATASEQVKLCRKSVITSGKNDLSSLDLQIQSTEEAFASLQVQLKTLSHSMDAAFDTISAVVADLIFLASARTMYSARLLLQACSAIHSLSQKDLCSTEEWERAIEAVSSARSELVNVCRKELGI